MKKLFLVAVASMLTLGFRNSLQAHFYSDWYPVPYEYHHTVVVIRRPVTYYSPLVYYDNDGAELPRGILAVSGAALLGALAVAAFQNATN